MVLAGAAAVSLGLAIGSRDLIVGLQFAFVSAGVAVQVPLVRALARSGSAFLAAADHGEERAST